jgi:hypothetical protein
MVKQSKSKSDAPATEYVCVFSAGRLKQNTVTFMTSSNPVEDYGLMKQRYGTQLKGSYAESSNAEKDLNELSEYFSGVRDGETDLYGISIKLACEQLTKVTDAKKLNHLKPEKVAGSETDAKSKKGAKSEDDTKGKKKGGKGKKDEAAAAAAPVATEEKKGKGKKSADEKPVAKGKGKGKGKPVEKDTSDDSDTKSVSSVSSKSSVSSVSSASSSSSSSSASSVPSVKSEPKAKGKGKGKGKKE